MSMITLSGPFERIDGTHQKAAEGPAEALKPGDRLAAKVLRIGSDQRVQMDFGRFRAMAQIDHPVKPGQILLLKVMDGGPPLHMQILTDKRFANGPSMPHIDLTQALSMAVQRDLGKLLDRMLDSKALAAASYDQPHLRQALVDLRDLTTPLSLASSLNEILSSLQHTIENRSLFFERKIAQWLLTDVRDGSAPPSQENVQSIAKMDADPAEHPRGLGRIQDFLGLWDRLLATRDFKSQLILIKWFFNQMDSSEAKTYALNAREVTLLRGVVEHLLGHLHEQQERLVQRSSQSDLFQVLTHWLPVEEQSQPLKIKLYYPKKERPRAVEAPQYVCLLLDMDRLGPVRTDLKLTHRQLQITFSVLTQDVRQAFESTLSSIMPALEGLFDKVEALVQVSEEKIARFDEEQMVTLEPGRIDIQV